MTARQLPPDVRAIVVSSLARSLAAAWRREYDQKHEQPARLNHAAGCIVRGAGDREHHERNTIDV